MIRQTTRLFSRKFLAPQLFSGRYYATAQPTNQDKTPEKSTPPPQQTASKGVKKAELFPEIRSALKPDVLKFLEDKGDELLIKKLNFVGAEGACRLNCASKLLMSILSHDNIFRILRDEVIDNWTYYWKNICDNGSDPQKWLTSLKEVQDLPFVLERCWQVMRRSNVNPSVEHYAVYCEGMGRSGNGVNAGVVTTQLRRQNYERRGSDLSACRIGIARGWSRHISREIPLIFYDYLKEKNTNIPNDLEEHFKKLEREDDSPIADYFFSDKKDKVEPPLFKERLAEFEAYAGKWMQQDMIDRYLQPPLEKLYNVEDKRREELKKSETKK